MTRFVPTFFITQLESEFVIVVVYVDNLNIIDTRKDFLEVVECLKREFKMKDLGKIKFYLNLQIKNLSNERISLNIIKMD